MSFNLLKTRKLLRVFTERFRLLRGFRLLHIFLGQFLGQKLFEADGRNRSLAKVSFCLPPPSAREEFGPADDRS